MYFVVYIESINDHLVIPAKWNRDLDITLQKFINYSINSNQKHLIYYNSAEGAVENSENVNPDFSRPIVTWLATDCCYIANVKKFFCKLNIYLIVCFSEKKLFF